jgi:hypothetical protein
MSRGDFARPEGKLRKNIREGMKFCETRGDYYTVHGEVWDDEKAGFHYLRFLSVNSVPSVVKISVVKT